VNHKGYNVRCGNCGENGHKARSCRKPVNLNRKKYPKQKKNRQAYLKDEAYLEDQAYVEDQEEGEIFCIHEGTNG
jgi:hypothetical protein